MHVDVLDCKKEGDNIKVKGLSNKGASGERRNRHP